MNEELRAPVVFVSYSHDSPEHKRWVTELASKLVHNGVDVILDQWELSLGDDLPKFMERSVRGADRVLMICTEAYVHKADDGKGGVGYEAIVVTGELVRDLGSSKFIPVLRQKAKPPVLPASVSTRFYVDFSDDRQLNERFDVLLRELHQAPAVKKPPIGKNPYAVSPSGRELPVEPEDHLLLEESSSDARDAGQMYRDALKIARRGDLLAWRELVRNARRLARSGSRMWRAEHDGKIPSGEDALVQESLGGISAFCPLMAIALAGVGSGRPKFANQLALLDDILFPKDWNRAGYTVRADLPLAAAFIYQALHGAICLQSDQLSLAMSWVRTPIEFPGSSEPAPIWRNHNIMGWPDSFAGKSTTAWKVLTSLPDVWQWLPDVFGDKDEYLASLCAYYMALNVHEYADLLASGRGASLRDQRLALDIPLFFESLEGDTKRRAYRLLTQDIEQVRAIWGSLGVSDSMVKEHWEPWNTLCSGWHRKVYRYAFRHRLAHAKLVDEVLARIGRQ